MIAKGNTHDNGARLARYITTGKESECAELWELRGFALRDIADAFRSIHVMASKGQCKQPFFHVQVRNPEGETLTRGQWKIAVDRIEGMMGLGDQPRAIAVHTDRKTGHEHIHIAWSRIDPETLLARPLPFFKLRLKGACRELESDLGLTHVPSDRKSSINYAPKRHEEQQAIRLGVAINDVREILKASFERSDCGRSFQSALADRCLILARGDQRDFVAIDRAGGLHALGKRILGASAADIRARLSDLSRDELPTVEEARQSLRTPQVPHVPVIAIPVPQPLTTPREEEPIQFTSIGPAVPASSAEGDGDPVQSSELYVQPATTPMPSPVDELMKVPEATQNNEQPRGLAATLKRQFRAAVKSLFKRTPSPQHQARRRRTGETVGSFRLTARRLLRPIIQLPVVAPVFSFLSDTLPWLHLWEWNDSLDNGIVADDFNSNDNHPSPHP